MSLALGLPGIGADLKLLLARRTLRASGTFHSLVPFLNAWPSADDSVGRQPTPTVAKALRRNFGTQTPVSLVGERDPLDRNRRPDAVVGLRISHPYGGDDVDPVRARLGSDVIRVYGRPATRCASNS